MRKLVSVFCILSSSAFASEPVAVGEAQAQGEAWLKPGYPPPQSDVPGMPPNIATMKDDVLWPLVKASNSRVLVGLKRPDLNRGSFRGEVLISHEEVQYYTSQLLSIQGTASLDFRPIVLVNGLELPVVSISLKDISALSQARAQKFVEYVEPHILPMDSISCGPDTYLPNTTDIRMRDERLGLADLNVSFPVSTRSQWTSFPMSIDIMRLNRRGMF